MPNIRKPRSGSMQFWPRKRASREYPRMKTRDVQEPKPLGFAGYKVGMTHISFIENNKFSPNRGEEVSMPVTIIECPPLKVVGARYYTNAKSGLSVLGEKWVKPEKELGRKLAKPVTKATTAKVEESKVSDIRLIVHTQPKLTGIGKKKPELFEIPIGGNLEEKKQIVEEKLGKEILIQDIFAAGTFVDISAVTRGKGFQGPVKRFGIAIRQHKSEKSIRNPGSLGPWSGHAHFMWRVPHAGKMGYHTRTEFNKRILKISNEAEEIAQEGGFHKYGNVKNSYIMVKGSVAGPKKRIVFMTPGIREPKGKIPDVPEITFTSKASKQGR